MMNIPLICRLLVFLSAFYVSTPVWSQPSADGAPKLPQILHDINALPPLVAKMRQNILRAALTGDLEALRTVLDSNEMKPLVSYGGDEDPLAFWKKNSADGEGREILAIMTEVLTSRFTKVERDGGQTVYVWPYFAEWPLDNLSPSQEVELYRLVSPKEAKTMREFGGYIHYRLGIGDDGTWHYFVAGD